MTFVRDAAGCRERIVQREIPLYAWERLIPELRRGAPDAIAAGMSNTEKRSALVALAVPYEANIVRFVARRGPGLHPARLPGAKVGVMSATVSADRLARNGGDRVSVRLRGDRATLHTRLPRNGRVSPAEGLETRREEPGASERSRNRKPKAHPSSSSHRIRPTG